MFDLGQAADSMMLVAWELGIGSVPATVYEHDLAQRLLGYPDGQHCEFLLSFGYPGRPGRPDAPAQGRRPAAARRPGPLGALVDGRRRVAQRAPAYCHWNLRAAIAKQTTSHAARTPKQTVSGANAAPPTMICRSASAR